MRHQFASQVPHEAIRAHGTHADKIRAALTHHAKAAGGPPIILCASLTGGHHRDIIPNIGMQRLALLDLHILPMFDQPRIELTLNPPAQQNPADKTEVPSASSGEALRLRSAQMRAELRSG